MIKNTGLWLETMTRGPAECMVLVIHKCATVTQVHCKEHLAQEYQVLAQLTAAESHYFQWQWKTIERSHGKLCKMLWQV